MGMLASILGKGHHWGYWLCFCFKFYLHVCLFLVAWLHFHAWPANVRRGTIFNDPSSIQQNRISQLFLSCSLGHFLHPSVLLFLPPSHMQSFNHGLLFLSPSYMESFNHGLFLSSSHMQSFNHGLFLSSSHMQSFNHALMCSTLASKWVCISKHSWSGWLGASGMWDKCNKMRHMLARLLICSQAVPWEYVHSVHMFSPFFILVSCLHSSFSSSDLLLKALRVAPNHAPPCACRCCKRCWTCYVTIKTTPMHPGLSSSSFGSWLSIAASCFAR